MLFCFGRTRRSLNKVAVGKISGSPDSAFDGDLFRGYVRHADYPSLRFPNQCPFSRFAADRLILRQPFVIVLVMPSRYAQWMYDWETRLTSVDNNRVVRPLDWGVEWARDWPCRNGYAPGHLPDDAERYLREYNRRIIASSM